VLRAALEGLDCKHDDCQVRAKEPLACDSCMFNPLGKGPEYREYRENPETAELAFQLADYHDFGIIPGRAMAMEELEAVKAVHKITEYANQQQLVFLISKLFSKSDGK
jgi:hypothetical protein